MVQKKLESVFVMYFTTVIGDSFEFTPETSLNDLCTY